MSEAKKNTQTDAHSEKTMFIVLLSLTLLMGCGGKKVKMDDNDTISNPFANAETTSQKPGVVVKRSYGLNSIEVALPGTNEDTLIRYPLAELKKEDLPDPSSADSALMKSLHPDKGEKTEETEEKTGVQTASFTTTTRQNKSYLLGIAKIKEHYRKKEYELALIHLEPLLEAYPNDFKLLSLRGTIANQLGYHDLAHDSWTRVLKQDPRNSTVLSALNHLQKRKFSSSQQNTKASTKGETETSQ